LKKIVRAVDRCVADGMSDEYARRHLLATGEITESQLERIAGYEEDQNASLEFDLLPFLTETAKFARAKDEQYALDRLFALNVPGIEFSKAVAGGARKRLERAGGEVRQTGAAAA
jgi:hypothetical protein